MSKNESKKKDSDNRRAFLKTLGLTMSVAALESNSVSAEELTQKTQELPNEWTTARSNSNRTGAISESGPAPYATTDWKLDLDGGMFHKEPIVANDTMYLSLTTAISSDESEGLVGAYDTETGHEEWKQPDIPSPQTPTVDDDLLYVATNVPETAESTSGGLFALAVDSGEIVWSRTDKLRWVAPIVANDRIFTLNKDGALALERTTGETVWKTNNVGKFADGHAGAISYSDGVIFCSDGTALNAADGSILWEIPDDSFTSGNPIISNGRVYYLRVEYIDGGDDTVTLEARSTTDGTVDWSVTLEDKTVMDRQFAISGDHLIIFSSKENSSVTALHSETGEELWTQEVTGEYLSNPTIADDTVFIGGRYILSPRSGKGKAIVYAIDISSGDIKWVHLLNSDQLETSPEEPPAAGVPVVVDGNIYLATYPAGSIFEYEYIFYSNIFVLGSSTTQSSENKR